jgi:predicted HTH transcriptional regulator
MRTLSALTQRKSGCKIKKTEVIRMLDFDNLQQYREDNRIEAKEALGGLPESIWETYSAFANAEGGIILLGVEELPDKSLHALNILDPHWLIEDFWRIINNPAFVSANILTEENVQIHMIDGKQIIAITVPKADAQRRPVYIGTDPYRGSYRRCGEGDYRLTKEEVDTMLAQRR